MSSSSKTDKQFRGEIWKDWAVAAQEGNKKAYNKLLTELSSFTRNYLLSRVANPEWAEDITQEVLISVHKSLKTYSGDRPFTPWLMAIISFRKTDFLRKHYSSRGDKQAPLEDAEFLNTHVTNPNRAGEYKDIEGALATLPEKQRKVFELIRIQGYTAQEVANEMKMSVSAVKVSAHRTANKLKTLLNE
jgi:RNA polymerase sigma-70 factor (ECF subfamily)